MAQYFFVDYLIITLIAYFFSLQTERYINLLEQMKVASIEHTKALSVSESRYKAVLKSSLHGVMITDADNLIVDVNKAFEKVTGYSLKEVIGKNPNILHSNKQDAAFYKKMWGDLNEYGQWEGIIWNKRKNGDVYPENISISSIQDHRGKKTNYVCIFSDISKQLLMEEKLRQGQKLEAVGILVAGIAHEFNNMLASITGNVYLAQKKARENPDLLQNLARIDSVSHKAAKQIQQLLIFARKDMANKNNINFTTFVEESLSFFKTTVPANIVLKEELSDATLLICGDETQLQQVLLNLVKNACDAVERVNNPQLTIKLEQFFADEEFVKSHLFFKTGGLYAHLSIVDNGEGIPEKNISHVFEPFYTSKEQGKGTGLGLSMVYGAIKSHHGYIEVESTNKKGSVFHIYIPLVTVEGISVEQTLTPKSVERQNTEVILLADDDEMVLETMKETLSSLGYSVLTAQDGVVAEKVFMEHQNTIDIALLDVVMPHLGGIELAVQIRQVKPNIPIIFLTAYDKKDTLMGESFENSQILSKPVSFEQLNQSIHVMVT